MKTFNIILITLIIIFLISFVVAEIFDVSIQFGEKDEPQEIVKGDEEQNMQELPEVKELTAQILQQGVGERQVKAGDEITVHYTGVLLDGTKFDSSVDRGEPFKLTIGVGQVISGWDQGVIGMKVGEMRRLNVPAEFAYGDQAVGNIPPNSPLIFEIELITIDNEEIVADEEGEGEVEDSEEKEEEEEEEEETTSSDGGVSTGLTAEE